MTTPSKEDLTRIERKIDLLLDALCPRQTIREELAVVEALGGNKIEHLKRKFKRDTKRTKAHA